MHTHTFLKIYTTAALFASLVLSLFLPATVAQAYPEACGTETKAGRLVPDAPLRYDFGPACARHDACYGNPYTFKEACDETFRRDMVAVCDTTDQGIRSWSGWNLRSRSLRRACLGLAYTYYWTVVQYGQK